MNDPLPVFRFQPNPLADGSIMRNDIVCSVCGKQQEYQCWGPFYRYENSRETRVTVCPWCLAGGLENHEIYHRSTSSGSFESQISLDLEKEILFKTPGFNASYVVWRTHCDLPCAYLGIAHKEDLLAQGIDIRTALVEEAKHSRLTPDEVFDQLSHNAVYTGHLFRCLSCGEYRLLIDNE